MNFGSKIQDQLLNLTVNQLQAKRLIAKRDVEPITIEQFLIERAKPSPQSLRHKA